MSEQGVGTRVSARAGRSRSSSARTPGPRRSASASPASLRAAGIAAGGSCSQLGGKQLEAAARDRSTSRVIVGDELADARFS
jgi:hypothetical protein